MQILKQKIIKSSVLLTRALNWRAFTSFNCFWFEWKKEENRNIKFKNFAEEW
jgi:hypothetical protein